MIIFNQALFKVEQDSASKVAPPGQGLINVLTGAAASKMVEEYNNSKDDSIVQVHIGPNTIGIVQKLFYDKENGYVVGQILFPFNLVASLIPKKEITVGNERRILESEIRGVEMIPVTPIEVPAQASSSKEE